MPSNEALELLQIPKKNNSEKLTKYSMIHLSSLIFFLINDKVTQMQQR